MLVCVDWNFSILFFLSSWKISSHQCKSEQQIKTHLTRLNAKLKLTVARKNADFALDAGSSTMFENLNRISCLFPNSDLRRIFLRTLLIRVLILRNPKEFYGWVKSEIEEKAKWIYQSVVLISDSITFMIIAWVDENFDRHYILMMLTSTATVWRQSIDERKWLIFLEFHWIEWK